VNRISRALLAGLTLVTGVASGQGAPARLFTPPVPVAAVAAPRTIQVFAVPVPADLRSDRPVSYTVTPAGGATIIPPLRGVVPADGNEHRSILVAASVPAGAIAGRSTIAAVQFSQGSGAVWVPLELRVSQTRGAVLRLAQPLVGAQPGDRVVIRYFLTNTGNAPDTLDLTVAGPPHWAMTGAPRRYALQLGQMVEGELTLTAPRTAEAGIVQVTLTASSGAERLATAQAVIELLETPGVRAAFGPKLVAGVASVMRDSSASPVFGLELSGPITDQIQAFGRLVQATDPGSVDQRGLARIGYFVGAPYLTLVGRQWQVTGGTTGRSFSDVTGVSAYGRGASVSWSESRWSTAALAAVPIAVTPSFGGDAHLLGLRVGRQLPRPGTEVNATLTTLRDPQLTPRLLDAAGIGVTSPLFQNVTASGELAQRWYAGGSGLGWVTQLKHQRPQDMAELRLVHAPGGSAAFAHARNELTANASRMFGRRGSIGAGYWSSDDDNAVFTRLHSAGWSFAPRYEITPHTSLQLEARSNSFEAVSAAGLLGNGETVVQLGVTTQRGTAYLSLGGTLGSARQTAALPGGAAIETSAGRQSVKLTAGAATDRGTFEVSGGFDHSGAGIGLLPNAIVVGARAQGVALTSSARSPMASAEVQYYGWFGDRPAVAVARLGLTAPLPGSLLLTVDIERNPFVTGLVGGAGITPVLKITRSLTLPVGNLRPSAKGEVFEDLNANGVRDPGEPAMAGAVMRRGTESVVTDRAGRFRFYSKSDSPVRLDETSLPVGVIASPAVPGPPQRPGALEFRVIPTTQVDVRIVPTADSAGRVPHVDLNGISLQAFDSLGNAWSARTDASGLGRFYALPPGRYRVQVDVSGLREPVRVGPAPVFTVEPNHPVPVQTVPLLPRPIKLFDPNGAQSRAAEGRRPPGQ
jgi:hypothetical protein